MATPNGQERIWGLEKISLLPDPSLFSPPKGYEMQYGKTDNGAAPDLEALGSWFRMTD